MKNKLHRERRIRNLLGNLIKILRRRRRLKTTMMTQSHVLLLKCCTPSSGQKLPTPPSVHIIEAFLREQRDVRLIGFLESLSCS